MLCQKNLQGVTEYMCNYFSLIGKTAIKLASLSTMYLRIYEDEPDKSAKIEVPVVKEPTTKILYEIRLKCVGCNFESCNHGFQAQVGREKNIRTLSCTTYHRTGGLNISLLFDFPANEVKFHAWNQAIQRAEELSSKGKTIFNNLCNHV